MKCSFILSCFLCFAFAKAQEPPHHLDFSLLRQDDHIVMNESENTSFYHSLKKIKLGRYTTLSFGGSYRFQSELFINEEFSREEDQNDIWFLHRLQLHSHLKFSDNFEVFAELNSSLIDRKKDRSPVDKDELSIHQLFAKYHFADNWNVLVGRQNLRLGSGRLVDIREGPNVRLSFDMGQIQFKDENTDIRALHAIPVVVEEGVFDNDALNTTESLTALYWTQYWKNQTNTDIYALYKKEENKIWTANSATDRRFSFGVRHFGKWKGLTYNNEFVYQIGSFGRQTINAYTASFNLEYPVNLIGKEGVLGLKTEVVSGDRSDTDNEVNTFDGLYPRSAYFGRVARIGPSNLIDIHPYYNTQIGGFLLEVDYVAFWRFSLDDGVYGPSLNLQYPPVNNRFFIGHQFGALTVFEVNTFLSFEFETNVIIPGAFLSQSNLDDTLFHAVFTAVFKF